MDGISIALLAGIAAAFCAALLGLRRSGGCGCGCGCGCDCAHCRNRKTPPKP